MPTARSAEASVTASPAGSLGSLVQEYVDVQCGVILEARTAIEARDEDAVHPVRVAIRRLRATLSTFGGVYRRIDREGLAQEAKWAGLLLGDVRDLQVLAERFAAESPSNAVGEVIEADIARRQVQAWRAVTDGLGGARGVALFAQLERWREDPPFTDKADRPAARALPRIKKADKRVRSRLERARSAAAGGDEGAGELLHDARKAAKRHRYAVELAQPILGADAERTIEKRQALQDALGAHQDAVVALAFLRAIDVSAQNAETTRQLGTLIESTRDSADDVAAVLRDAKHSS
jgi:CHAD domain-containing protein